MNYSPPFLVSGGRDVEKEQEDPAQSLMLGKQPSSEAGLALGALIRF